MSWSRYFWTIEYTSVVLKTISLFLSFPYFPGIKMRNKNSIFLELLFWIEDQKALNNLLKVFKWWDFTGGRWASEEWRKQNKREPLILIYLFKRYLTVGKFVLITNKKLYFTAHLRAWLTIEPHSGFLIKILIIDLA